MTTAVAEEPEVDLTPVVPAIELKGISKAFGPVQANKNISISVKPGTIHGIIGENGAGKSTLMSILYGFYKADSGKIFINGRETDIPDSQAAIKAGIGMVFQHFKLVQNFTVLENVILGAEDGPLLRPSLNKARGVLKQLAEEYELNVDPDAIVENLDVGHQQRVEILKALYREADILILDEPTGVLTPAEADHLFRILENLRAEGKTIILITHKLREIMDATNTVSVMRRGEMTATVQTSETSPERLAEMMVGRKVLLQVDKKEATPGAPVLEVENLRLVDDKGVERLKGISLEVRAGEILGIAGVAGNGQSELLEVLGGYADATGRAKVNGQTIKLGESAKKLDLGFVDWIAGLIAASVVGYFAGPWDGFEITSFDWVELALGVFVAFFSFLLFPKKFDSIIAAQRRKEGIAHVPEDRHREGLIMPFSAWENTVFGYHSDPSIQSGFLMNNAAIKAEAAAKMDRFDVRPPNPKLAARNFSGGNQQKIVLAREIERNPDILLIGQPTRGVDIGAIEFIHQQIVRLRDEGKAILLVSVELDEIFSLSDRIAVMFDGQIMGERLPSQTNERELGLLMAGITDTAAVVDETPVDVAVEAETSEPDAGSDEPQVENAETSETSVETAQEETVTPEEPAEVVETTEASSPEPDVEEITIDAANDDTLATDISNDVITEAGEAPEVVNITTDAEPVAPPPKPADSMSIGGFSATIHQSSPPIKTSKPADKDPQETDKDG